MSAIDEAITGTGYEREPRQLVFSGRNGRGLEVRVYAVGSWLDIWHVDVMGEPHSFSLNSDYTAKLVKALVGLLAERSL